MAASDAGVVGADGIAGSFLGHRAETCRRKGLQIGTIDALIARLSIEHELNLLTADTDLGHAARFVPLRLAT
ncbi:MAG: hypothetical protein U1A22_07790 [Xanthomonadaceae bacterium]|nr:hypothetical protein [Xanthomonadaceae bacterium]